ncbi:MAG: hypothetical protein NTY53_21855 [Kiritimatiellaeota bacterium]|nr:hypothetical protein [Kiritimatiellota bacterium]
MRFSKRTDSNNSASRDDRDVPTSCRNRRRRLDWRRIGDGCRHVHRRRLGRGRLDQRELAGNRYPVELDREGRHNALHFQQQFAHGQPPMIPAIELPDHSLDSLLLFLLRQIFGIARYPLQLSNNAKITTDSSGAKLGNSGAIAVTAKALTITTRPKPNPDEIIRMNFRLTSPW